MRNNQRLSLLTRGASIECSGDVVTHEIAFGYVLVPHGVAVVTAVGFELLQSKTCRSSKRDARASNEMAGESRGISTNQSGQNSTKATHSVLAHWFLSTLQCEATSDIDQISEVEISTAVQKQSRNV